MRRRVLDHIPANQAERQLKLGSGGLRDVEFAVQLLQMVHGRTDEKVRPPTTLSALARLTEGGYVGREDGRALHDAYAFLRTLEHRIQLYQLRRTHVMPEDEASLRRLGRSLGYTKEPVRELDREWHFHQREVRRLHEKLFYRPLLSAVARISGDEARLSPAAARARLSALGYEDPTAALRHLEALTAGVTRTAQIQRTLLPVMLEWFADAPDPDAGLFGFRRISEALGSTPWYLRLLRDEGEAAQRMAQVLATSRYATDLLQREPQGVAILGEQERLEPLEPRRRAERDDVRRRTPGRRGGGGRRDPLRASARAAADQRGGPVRALRRGRGRLRAHRRHQRHPRGDARGGDPVGREVEGRRDADPDGDHRDGSLRRLRVRLRQRRRRDVRARPAARCGRPARGVDGPDGGQRRTPAADRAVPRPIPRGRHRPAPRGATGPAGAHPRVLCRLLRQVVRGLGGAGAAAGGADRRRPGTARALPGADRPAAVPRGGAQPRRRGGGTPHQGARRLRATAPRRRPGDELQARSWRTLRRGVDRPAAADGARRADPGAAHHQDARGAAGGRGARAARPQRRGAAWPRRWRFASRARNATVQVRGKPADQLPRDARERAAVAAILQYEPGQSDEMVNDYLRAARRARGIVDRVFWS